LWGVTWTLQFEFLFYLLVPFLGWFAQTLWRTLLFIGGCNVLYAASLLVNTNHPHLHAFLLFRALLRFLSFTFCIGFVTAHLTRIAKVRELARSAWAAPLSLALVVVTLCFLPPHHGPLESIVLAIPFIAVAGGCDFWGALRQRPLLFLGQISYSVYLIHCLLYAAILIPLYNVLGPTMKSGSLYWIIVFVTAPVIIGMSTLWNQTFELPFMGKRTAPARPIGVAPLQSVPPS
jgi:peptidoglycan/LPS O-acetylase OafA/YrhL